MNKGSGFRLASVIAVIVILIVALLYFTGLGRHLTSFDKKGAVHIALVGPMTGRDSVLGKDLVHGATLCVEEINDSGGIDGRKVVLDVYDDQDDPAKAEQRPGRYWKTIERLP